MNALLVVLLLGPLVMAAVAAVIGRNRSRLAGRLGAGAAALGFLGAAVLAVAAASATRPRCRSARRRR